MSEASEIFLFLSPDVERFLAENDIDIVDIIKRTKQPIQFGHKKDPDARSSGTKDPVTVMIAAAAVIAAATPLLREAIRALAGRDTVIRERRLRPVEDVAGNIVRDSNGGPILHWVDEVVSEQQVKIDGPLGIKISFGEKS